MTNDKPKRTTDNGAVAAFSFDADNANNAGQVDGAGKQSIGQSGTDSGVGSEIGDNAERTGNNASDPDKLAGKEQPKKRGRKALPRDANGNIIRDASATNQSDKAGLDLNGFKVNDRGKIRQQIQGMHGAAAVLTGQAVFNLHDMEAIALTNALCDVLDYHQINLTQSGGVYGLYITLAITAFGVYKPRFDIITSGGNIVGMAPNKAQPTSEEEAKQAFNETGMMNFNEGTMQ